MTRELDRQGHAVQVITISRGTDTWIEDEGRTVIRLRAGRQRLMVPSARELLQSYLALRRQVPGLAATFDPDALLAYFAFPAGHACLVARKRIGRPLIVSLRGSDVPGFSEGRWGPFRLLRPWLLRSVWKEVDSIVANGEFLAGLGELVKPARQITTIPNGVDIRRYRPPKQRRKNDCIRLLFVGQLIERKGCQEMMEAVATLSREGISLELTVVGDGPLRPKLETIVAGLGQEVVVALRGHARREQMPGIYRSHDVLIHPSRAEGVSNVLLEAMASGLAVVATQSAAGGIMSDGVEGTVIAETSASAIATAVSALTQHRLKLESMQRAARRTAERHSWEQCAKALADHVSSVVFPDREALDRLPKR